MPHMLRDLPSSAALTPEPQLDSWEEHEHLMNPMFLQSPDEIDLPPLDPELLDHQRRRQVGVSGNIIWLLIVIQRKFQNLLAISFKSVTPSESPPNTLHSKVPKFVQLNGVVDWRESPTIAFHAGHFKHTTIWDLSLTSV